jgi:hypothetical protein
VSDIKTMQRVVGASMSRTSFTMTILVLPAGIHPIQPAANATSNTSTMTGPERDVTRA